MYFSIACDEAVLEMDSWREHSRQLRVFPARGRPFSPRLPPVDAYGAQIDYFARQIRSGLPFERVPTGEAIAALAMCEASRESCRSGTPVSVGTP
jgi:predicted dehydrogenase